MSDVIIVKAGSKLDELRGVQGDFEDWILAGLDVARDSTQVVSAFHDEPLPELSSVRGIVVTGSTAMVTEAKPWIEHAATWLKRAVEQGIPTLGICFGHQLLAHALGGRVGDNPLGVEVGTIPISRRPDDRDDPLLEGLPATFLGHTAHQQTIDQLPPGAQSLAYSALDPHQSVRFTDQAWGVQFHPEFTTAIVRQFVAYYRSTLVQQDRDPDQIKNACRETPQASALLRRFGHLCVDRPISKTSISP